MKKIIIVACLCFCLVSHAQTAKEALTAELLATKTLSGTFTQTIRSDVGELLQKATGTFALATPGKFYWHTQAPDEQDIVVNAGKVTLIDREIEQVTIRTLDGKSADQLPVMLLTGNPERALSDFSVKKTAEGYQLFTDEEGSIVKQLTLRFNQQGIIEEILFVNALNQVTDILFHDLQANRTVNESLFRAHDDKNMDVVYST